MPACPRVPFLWRFRINLGRISLIYAPSSTALPPFWSRAMVKSILMREPQRMMGSGKPRFLIF